MMKESFYPRANCHLKNAEMEDTGRGKLTSLLRSGDPGRMESHPLCAHFGGQNEKRLEFYREISTEPKV